MRISWFVAAAFFLGARIGGAQTVRGTVVDDGERSVPGVVVILVDAANREVARTLTSERGEFRIVAPRPGSYRLRTLRIGFQSVLTEPIAFVVGDEHTRRLVVSSVAFVLDTVRATGRNPCRVVAGDSTSVVSAIWDQVRNALIATQLSLNNRTIYNTTLAYERVQDIRSQRIGSQTLDVRADFARQPWRSLSPDSLRRVGYVFTDSDSNRIYNSPDLAVLLSDEFLEDHCLRIAERSDDERLGIEFRPTPARRRISEIRGTLWLDRKTNELVEMEHGYINDLTREEERNAGGTMGFTRMRNGMWAISRWSIRMPMMVMAPVYGPSLQIIRYTAQLDSLKVTGGELVMATTTGTRRDTIWMRPTVSLRGVVVDSISGAPVSRAIVSLGGTVQVDTTGADGYFDIHGVLPGRYAVNVTTPSLDSVNTIDQRSIVFADSSLRLTIRVPNATLIAGSVCGRSNTATRLGAVIVLGTVIRGRDSVPIANARVSAEWTETAVIGSRIDNRVRAMETRTDARGVFRICGLPTSTAYTLYASSTDGEAAPVKVTLGGEQLFARAELVVGEEPRAASVFTGTVVDSAGRPLADVDVLIPALNLGTQSTTDGAFRITGITPGTHAIVARRVGYGPLETTLAFAPGRVIEQKIQLTRITLLDSVTTTARSFRDPNLDEFEERRRLGRGHFITRDEIVKREGMLLSSFLSDMPGMRVHDARGGQWAIGVNTKLCTERAPDLRQIENAQPARGPGALCQIIYVPGTDEARAGVPIACFSKVYVDNALVNPGSPTPPFNLRDIPPTRVEAIEYYSRSSELPAQLYALDSACGVIVIHTRRPG
jgi:hypothetical protein